MIAFFILGLALFAVAVATLSCMGAKPANNADPVVPDEMETWKKQSAEAYDQVIKGYQEALVRHETETLPEWFKIWCKHTGNPGNLTIEEWKTLQAIERGGIDYPRPRFHWF